MDRTVNFQSWYQFLGIPESLSVAFTSLAFLILLTPLLSGITIFGSSFPNLTANGKKVFAALGILLFPLSLYAYFPHQLPPHTFNDGPTCILASKSSPGENKYSIEWIALSEGPSVVRLGGVAVENAGFIEYEWNPENVFLTFELRVRDKNGSCERYETVWNPLVNWDEPLECNILVENSPETGSEPFKIQWSVSRTFGTVVRLNGNLVEQIGSDSFILGDEPLRDFVLEARTRDQSCIRSVRVQKAS